MMSEHIYVNMTNGPVRVTLPSGAGYELPAGHAIRGAHFLRTAQAGVLVPIEGCDQKREYQTHNPLNVREKTSPPPSEPAEETPSPASDAGSSDPTEDRSGDAGEDARGAPVASETEAPTFLEQTREQWVEWLGKNSDPSVMTRLKLAEMRDLAAFLGAPVAGESKGDLLGAIRGAVSDG